MDFSHLMEHLCDVYAESSSTDAGGGTALTYTSRDTGVAVLIKGDAASLTERFDQGNLIGPVTLATYYSGTVRGDRLTVTAGPGMVGLTLKVTGIQTQPGVEMLGIDTLYHLTGEQVV